MQRRLPEGHKQLAAMTLNLGASDTRAILAKPRMSGARGSLACACRMRQASTQAVHLSRYGPDHCGQRTTWRRLGVAGARHKVGPMARLLQEGLLLPRAYRKPLVRASGQDRAQNGRIACSNSSGAFAVGEGARTSLVVRIQPFSSDFCGLGMPLAGENGSTLGPESCHPKARKLILRARHSPFALPPLATKDSVSLSRVETAVLVSRRFRGCRQARTNDAPVHAVRTRHCFRRILLPISEQPPAGFAGSKWSRPANASMPARRGNVVGEVLCTDLRRPRLQRSFSRGAAR